MSRNLNLFIPFLWEPTVQCVCHAHFNRVHIRSYHFNGRSKCLYLLKGFGRLLQRDWIETWVERADIQWISCVTVPYIQGAALVEHEF